MIMKIRHIVIGQYLGIGVLTMVSIIGALGVSVVPDEYVGLLGSLPIYFRYKNDYVNHKKENPLEDIKIEEKNDTQENGKITVFRGFH